MAEFLSVYLMVCFFHFLSYCLVYLSAILLTMDQMVERARWRTRAFTHNCTHTCTYVSRECQETVLVCCNFRKLHTNILTGSRIAVRSNAVCTVCPCPYVGFFPTQQQVTGKQSATHFFINYACIIALAYAAIKRIQHFTPSTLETERHFCSQGRCGEL